METTYEVPPDMYPIGTSEAEILECEREGVTDDPEGAFMDLDSDHITVEIVPTPTAKG